MDPDGSIEVAKRHNSHRLHAASQHRRTVFLNAIRAGLSVTDACKQANVAKGTYAQWRSRDTEFAAKVDVAKTEAMGERKATRYQPAAGMSWTERFIRWRRLWADHQTPWFQAEIFGQIQEMAPGDILLVLLPPEHGKTTAYEDYATMTIAENPRWMGHVGSESVSLSKKILGRIMDRLSPVVGSTWVSFVEQYGPFAPLSKMEGGHTQPWTATHFDVFKKGEFDDRDYTLAALGFGSQIIGSRSMHLHCDDLQSTKTLGQTESILNTWRQDWLSRPGETGITTVMGNRVDEGDIYEAMVESLPPDVLRVVRYPALLERNGEVEPLWPERWSLKALDRMKSKVSNPVWERNWMQRPQARSLKTFTDDIVGKALNPLLSLSAPLADRPDGSRTVGYLSLDPSIGGRTVISGWAILPKGMRLVQVRDEVGLTSNQAIARVIEEMIRHARLWNLQYTDLIIETMAFQKGLLADEGFLWLRDQWGVALRPHLTGINKYDENIGVPSMVSSFLQDQIEIPYAADDLTRLHADGLKGELLAWRPRKKGTELVQDFLMTLWFAWIMWRSRRGAAPDPNDGDRWRTRAMPDGMAPTRTGLILPTTYQPILA